MTASTQIKGSGRSVPDSRRDLVSRIVTSPTFAKSARLSSFLAFVCDLTFQGRAHEINEQRIGEAVFGRPPDYDPSIDGIVRTQASRLRQKLETYFNEEGASETLRLSIPRGGYVPVFGPAAGDPVSPSPVSLGSVILGPAISGPVALGPVPLESPPMPALVPAQASPASPSFFQNGKIGWGVAGFLALVLIVSLFVRRTASPHQPALPLHPLWSRMFLEDQPTILVPGDSGLVIWEGLSGHKITLAEYLNGVYRTPTAPHTGLQAIAGPTTLVNLASRRYTSIVDLRVSSYFTGMASSYRSKLAVRYARDLRPDDLKQGNVILVGAQEANPWVELFERNMDFVFSNNLTTHIFSVINRSPRGNEPRQWDSDYYDQQHRVYGVAAFLPNLNGSGNVMILEGTSMSGTECASDFVADDLQLLPFLKKIARPDGSIPHFEVVLGTNNMGGSAAKGSVLAYRVID